MPKRQPKLFLEKLGLRIRARRIFVDRSLDYVAREADISKSQLSLYELGNGHPPSATLHRIAMSIGITSSELLGETMRQEQLDQFDTLCRVYVDPFLGPVLRFMQDMPAAQRRKVLAFVTDMVGSQVETVKVMK